MRRMDASPAYPRSAAHRERWLRGRDEWISASRARLPPIKECCTISLEPTAETGVPPCVIYDRPMILTMQPPASLRGGTIRRRRRGLPVVQK